MTSASNRSSATIPLTLAAMTAHPPGVYRLANPSRPQPILTTITDWGWYAGYINGKLVHGKSTFLVAAGQAFAFPSYYGQNWDAFEEMVNDLSWIQAAGYALLYDQAYRLAAAQPDAWQTALTILQNACSHWQQEGVPFYVLLRHNWHWNRRLPRLVLRTT
jgi:hypothetical protein